MKFQARQQGVTIVELMVALVLGIILTGGVVQIYLSTKNTHDITAGLSRMQESTRYSLDMMARDIRMAGYIPCGRPQTNATLVNSAGNYWWSGIFDQPIQGFEGGVSTFPADITSVANGRVATADALMVLRGGGKVAGVNFYNSASGRFVMQRNLGSGWGLEDGSLVIACDPYHAALFQAESYTVANPSHVIVSTGSSDEPGNCTTDLGDPGPLTCTSPGQSGTGYLFGNDAQLVDYKAVIYYVAESASGNDNSLYREYVYVVDTNQNVSTRAEELLEGVESMQLLYGVDQDVDGVAERYLKADAVDGIADGWSSVVTVRIGLLLASEDGLRSPLDIDTQTYRVANTTVGPESGSETVTHLEDRRKRYVSTTTVSIRNPNI